MKVTRLSATEYDVESQSLHCTAPFCSYVTKNAAAQIGMECPRCLLNKAAVVGRLWRPTYRVDITMLHQNGECGCDRFKYKLGPQLAAMSPDDRLVLRRRCKHIKRAREVAKEDANFDALLATLPDQEEQT